MEETCVVAWILTCEREDISELECFMVSAFIGWNYYEVLIDREESRGKQQAD